MAFSYKETVQEKFIIFSFYDFLIEKHSVHPLLSAGGGGALELKKGRDRALIFREGVVGKRRDLFFGGGPIFT